MDAKHRKHLEWPKGLKHELFMMIMKYKSVSSHLNTVCEYIEDIYFFEVNTKYISSSAVKKSVFFTSA